MKKITTLIIFLSFLISYGQSPDSSEDLINSEALEWLNGLNEKGLEITGDSIKIGKEFQKILSDAHLREHLYPETYSWNNAVLYLKSKKLKVAFWYFINLYPENETNKELVLKSVIAYDKVLKMDKIMVNTFNTYSFIDPEISIIKDGKPEIIHPDVLEKKLRDVNEIVAYIIKYRELNSVSEKKQ